MYRYDVILLIISSQREILRVHLEDCQGYMD